MTDKPTLQEIIAYAAKSRSYRKHFAIQELMHCCKEYELESQRSDKCHIARMQKRTEALYLSIDDAYSALHPEPLDKAEISMYRHLMIVDEKRRTQKK